MEACKKNLQGRKRGITKRITTIQRYIAEHRHKDDVTLKRDELKDAFTQFETVSEEYQEFVKENEEELEESYEDFEEVASSYIKALQDANMYIENEEPDQNGASSANSFMYLPKVEIQTFSGDPTQYHTFIAVFQESVEKHCADSGARLTRLLQYTDGKANKAISPCAIIGGKAGYDKARSILAQRFGDKHIISEAIVAKLRSGRTVHKKEEICELADELNSCVVSLGEMGKLQEIDTQRTIVDIIERLPRYIQNRWRKSAINTKRDSGSYPDIKKLQSFMYDIAEEVNDPVYGYHEDQSKKAQPPSKHTNKPQQRCSRTFNTSATPCGCSSQNNKNMQSQCSSATPYRHICPSCNESHRLFACPVFKSMKPLDRLNFVKSKKLCENCLLGNHSTVDCRKPGRCSVCGEKHTRFIHVTNENNPDHLGEANANHVTVNDIFPNDVIDHIDVNDTNVDVVDTVNVVPDVQVAHDIMSNQSKQVILPVVPVVVNGSYHTFALLDGASTNSFCSQHLADALRVKGVKTMLNLSTLEKSSSTRETKAVSFKVSTEGEMLHMSNVYVVSSIPVPVVKSKSVTSYKHLEGIQIQPPGKVDILIGQDCPDALIPIEVRKGGKGEPYAVKTSLGWSVSGPIGDGTTNKGFANYVKLDKQIEKMWQLDNELLCEDQAMSKQDQEVIDLWEEKSRLVNGHYELPIPWLRKVGEERKPNMPNNRSQAIDRFRCLKNRLQKNERLKVGYTQGIKTLLDKGFAEPVPVSDLDRDDGCVFYLPHHPVQSAAKDKIRIVFDCSAKYGGTSLNDQVLQGPDLTNKLTSVLLRFREEQVAVVGDVEAMYHQVKVPIDERDTLRFLWPADDDLDGKLLEYRMTVHLFGGVWSSSAANYALRKTADDNRGKYIPEAADSVLSNFYVDDWLKSTPTATQALKLTHAVTSLLTKGGFKLAKFMSTDRKVLKSIPMEDRGKSFADLDLDKHQLPKDRVLGVKWDMDNDMFYFKLTILARPISRRGIISIISAVYDPLGFLSPIVIVGKMMFQRLTKLKLSWDEPIPPYLEASWTKWLKELPMLENVRIPRCIKPAQYKKPIITQVHHFCDASQSAYGAVTYLRIQDLTGCIHVTLLLSKSRLAPVKVMSIPRLELTAAVLAAKMDKCLKSQLEMTFDETFFWSDSQLVLQYVQNERKRFHVFVANRIAVIQQASSPDQWRYVPSEKNPADYLTRGLNATNIIDSQWFSGPEFLKMPQREWTLIPVKEDIPPNDPEVKKENVAHIATTNASDPSPMFLDDLLARCSSFYKLKRIIAQILLLKRRILSKIRGQPIEKSELTIDLITESELEIIKQVQRSCFGEEYKALQKGNQLKRSSPLHKLTPFLQKDVMYVGGRLCKADLPWESKHQLIIPKNHDLGKLIIDEAHKKGHVGTEHVLATVRQKYWIIRARPTIKKLLNNCFNCKLRTKKPARQMMNELPADRLTSSEPPFTHTGTDCFGPLQVKRGRATVKRYGCIFTCLTMRAIHIEILHSMDSSSFINGLQRFIARRGKPKLFRSDNGTNIKGAERELRRSLDEISQQDNVKDFLLKNEMKWIFNTPLAAHHGGAWERQIQSIKKILLAVGGGKVLVMDDEQLATFLCTVESIINSRPISHNSDDPRDPEVLTPNHLLLLRAGPQPLGSFDQTDLYRRRWKQVQWLASLFWKRWIREYVPNLQVRSKCGQPEENIKVDDLVLLMDEQSPRSVWPLAKVLEAIKGRDNLVRTVKVKTSKNVLTRPITKVVLLESM